MTRTQRGITLVETSWALALVGILGSIGMARLDDGPLKLNTLRQELQGSLHQAFTLARARGGDVTVALGHRDHQDPALLPVPLPRGVQWGRPQAVPLPNGMDAAPVASSTGASHARITVTPRRTVTAGAWFFHTKSHALCLRLAGNGKLTTLRWRPSERRWTTES